MRVDIEDDLTKKERDIQKELRALAKEERQKGLRMKVGYKKIWIEGKGFRWDEEKGKLDTAIFSIRAQEKEDRAEKGKRTRRGVREKMSK
jgi:hypothetical protein